MRRCSFMEFYAEMQPSRRGDFLEGQVLEHTSALLKPLSERHWHRRGPHPAPGPWHQAPDGRPQVTVPTDEFLCGERGGNEDRSMAPLLARAGVPAWRSTVVPSLSRRFAAAGEVGASSWPPSSPARAAQDDARVAQTGVRIPDCSGAAWLRTRAAEGASEPQLCLKGAARPLACGDVAVAPGALPLLRASLCLSVNLRVGPGRHL